MANGIVTESIRLILEINNLVGITIIIPKININLEFKKTFKIFAMVLVI